MLGRSRPTQHAVFCVVAPFSELSLNHELSHEIATNLWGPAEHWLEEGFANYVVDNKSSLMNRQCLVMMQSKQWIPLKNLVNPEWKSSSVLSRRYLSGVGRVCAVPVRDLRSRALSEGLERRQQGTSGKSTARSFPS